MVPPNATFWFPGVILIEGTLPPPSGTGGAERNIRRLAEKELWEISERSFEAYGDTLDNVAVFKYMGRFITAGDEDWPVVAGIL